MVMNSINKPELRAGLERTKREDRNKELLAEGIRLKHTTTACWLRDQKMDESDAILKKIE